MKLRIYGRAVDDKTSPDFGPITEAELDEFFDWLGSEEADDELFWSSSVSQSGDTVIVEWRSDDPPNVERLIYLIAVHLNSNIAPYKKWEAT